MTEITKILSAIEEGIALAAEQLLPLVYDELRQLAAHRLAKERPNQTLQATALVHEAYLRLVDDHARRWDSRGHFFAAAAEAMRRILVETARAKKRLKRGGGRVRLDFEPDRLAAPEVPEDLLELDEALTRLRAADPKRLAKLVRGDLDWIVMRSLEKDRARRYESASGLARDIERYLDGDVVEACPPSAGYRLRKFVGKHRAALATATALAVTLVLAVVVSTWQAIRAFRSAAESKAVLAFVEDQFLIAARPKGQLSGLGKDVTLRQAVDAAEPKIKGSFPDQPIVEALVRDCLGNTYDYLGEPELGIKQHERAVQLLQANLGARNPNTIIVRANLAGSCLGAGRPAEAIPLFEESLRLGISILGVDNPDTLKCESGLAVAYWRTGQLDRSIPLFERALKLTAAKLGPDHPHTLTTQANLGINYRDAGRPADGARLMEEALRRARNHPDILADMAWVTSDLAMTYLAAGQLDKAESILRESVEFARKQFGAIDPRTADAIDDLAFGLLKRQNWVEAESLLRECPYERGSPMGR